MNLERQVREMYDIFMLHAAGMITTNQPHYVWQTRWKQRVKEAVTKSWSSWWGLIFPYFHCSWFSSMLMGKTQTLFGFPFIPEATWRVPTKSKRIVLRNRSSSPISSQHTLRCIEKMYVPKSVTSLVTYHLAISSQKKRLTPKAQNARLCYGVFVDVHSLLPRTSAAVGESFPASIAFLSCRVAIYEAVTPVGPTAQQISQEDMPKKQPKSTAQQSNNRTQQKKKLRFQLSCTGAKINSGTSKLSDLEAGLTVGLAIGSSQFGYNRAPA